MFQQAMTAFLKVKYHNVTDW